MKVTIFLLVILCIAVVQIRAQRAQCRAPANQNCVDARNVGRGGRGCRPVTTWYYNRRTRQCVEMRYLGCGGNRNRYCSKRNCEQRCRR